MIEFGIVATANGYSPNDVTSGSFTPNKPHPFLGVPIFIYMTETEFLESLRELLSVSLVSIVRI